MMKMARITIDIPDTLYEQLRDAAPESVPALDVGTVAVLAQAVRTATQAQQREELMRRLREAFGDELDDPAEFMWEDDNLSAEDRAERHRRLLALPPLDPPLSHAIRENRDEESY
jgi:hypothetical protein